MRFRKIEIKELVSADQAAGPKPVRATQELQGTLTVPDAASAGPASPPPAIAPFNETQARAYQDAWSKYLGLPVELENTIGMKFRLIPPGEFDMGSSADEIATVQRLAKAQEMWDKPFFEACLASEAPRHHVRLTAAYYCGAHEVTCEQFRQFVKAPSPDRSRNGRNGGVHASKTEISSGRPN